MMPCPAKMKQVVIASWSSSVMTHALRSLQNTRRDGTEGRGGNVGGWSFDRWRWNLSPQIRHQSIVNVMLPHGIGPHVCWKRSPRDSQRTAPLLQSNGPPAYHTQQRITSHKKSTRVWRHSKNLREFDTSSGDTWTSRTPAIYWSTAFGQCGRPQQRRTYMAIYPILQSASHIFVEPTMHW